MAVETKQDFEELQTLFTQMRGIIDEQKGGISAEVKTALDRFNARIDEIELSQKRPRTGLEVREGRETKMSGPTNATIRAYERLANSSQEAKSTFYKACRLGYGNLSGEERKMMRQLEPDAETKTMFLSDDTTGGFFAPADFIAMILKNVVLISNVRQFANVKPTSRESAQVGRRLGTPSATWGNEQTTINTTQVKYGREDVPTHKLTALCLINLQDLEDNIFDLEEELSSDLAEEFARAEGAAFVNGNGYSQPEGLLTNSSIAADNSGSSSTLTGDGLITMAHNLKDAYVPNARWYMNRQTLGVVRLLKDNQGRYLLQPGIAMGNPGTILESEYTMLPDLPAVSSGTYPILFGDMKKAYTIVDRIGMSMQRLDQLFAAQDAIGFKSRIRVGGQVVLPEALRKLVIHS